MIARTSSFQLLVRLLARVVWRSRLRIAQKLAGFAATEEGSALDMLRAAELEDDPVLRRQYFVHALDEHRHAAMFSAAAASIGGPAGARASSWERLHARRQDLFESMAPVAFLAFVHHAERQGQAHFAALAKHFAAHPELGPLFDEVERDERFHVAYSGRALSRLASAAGSSPARALWRVRAHRSWQAFRRRGRQLGEWMTQALLIALYVVVVPAFAVLARREVASAGWRRLDGASGARRLVDDLTRQHR